MYVNREGWDVIGRTGPIAQFKLNFTPSIISDAMLCYAMVWYICFFPTAQTKNRLPLFSALAGCRAVNVIPVPPIGGDSVLFEEEKKRKK